MKQLFPCLPCGGNRAVAARFALLVLTTATACGQGSGAAVAPTEIQTFNVPDRSHVQGEVSYPQTPPVGGPHNPVWQNCGFYSEPVANVHAVHSMEHGAVWLTYQPDLAAGQVDALRTLAESTTFVLVSPFQGLPAPVVASAWGRQLRLERGDDPRVSQFVRSFRQGPQTPEPGAPCTGGVGTPQP